MSRATSSSSSPVREHGCVRCLARDAGISQATSYRYLHEGKDVLADPR
ncbi:hypothetical protein FHU36_002938 [Nonomuraea muscovyensis]|uniref:Uncharacterized protein n=1 Tax=Nonomuraea muscovyensis TaxID=1124761 RepID=A0A7X0EYG4_9ACTN|nr:hypothetical protein [Nonomuraea muscovyensis]MBB6346429.1 hypothetical protein [Nonomuraea muscovyensis]